MTFLSDLATNATKQDIGFVFYSGNNDALIAHRGTEVTIQVKNRLTSLKPTHKR